MEGLSEIRGSYEADVVAIVLLSLMRRSWFLSDFFCVIYTLMVISLDNIDRVAFGGREASRRRRLRHVQHDPLTTVHWSTSVQRPCLWIPAGATVVKLTFELANTRTRKWRKVKEF